MRVRDLSRIDRMIRVDERRAVRRSQRSRRSLLSRPARRRPRHTTGDVPDHGAHDAYHGSHWPVTATTAQITAVTVPVTAVTAPNTADTAPARRAEVGTPERGRLLVPHRRSRASKAATRQAWRMVGGAGRCRQPRRRQPPWGLLSPGLGCRDKKNDATTNSQCTSSFVLVGTLGPFLQTGYS